MRTDLFDYELPPERIALTPMEPREHARLLVANGAGLWDRRVGDLPTLLRPGDLMVVNDTKVIPAALSGERPARRDGVAVPVSVNLIARLDERRWRAFARPGKRLKEADRVLFGGGALSAVIVTKAASGEIELAFDQSGADLDSIIGAVGTTPLPPYILAQRAVVPEDAANYQTIFASRPGAVAAPTAGLHFTDRLMTELTNAGIEQARVTLHVGAGTFLPVKTQEAEDHPIHAEWREVSQETAEAVNRAKTGGRRVIAIGTTALRALESSAEDGRVRPAFGETSLFITPGYSFQIIDGLWTNFHLPRSTLFMLVAAFLGLERAKAAYAHAVESGYRFYSYGDACLFWR